MADLSVILSVNTDWANLLFCEMETHKNVTVDFFSSIFTANKSKEYDSYCRPQRHVPQYGFADIIQTLKSATAPVRV